MATVHHNTTKRAQAHGLTIAIEGDYFVVSKDGVELARATNARDAVDLAIQSLPKAPKARKAKGTKARKAKRAKRGSDEGDEDEDGEEEQGKSIVKRKYRQLYRPTKMTCGDDLARKISDHVSREDEDGEVRINKAALREFAQANDCWVGSYSKLNVGQQRMNVGNRLRAKVKHGHKIVWA